ncbi:hypothetical protein BASA81_008710 [Batrachochytrium salamandrivorans]|nr:hypothetical protein BASA81_008710 [Batrachochytrium salamandrivorans]
MGALNGDLLRVRELVETQGMDVGKGNSKGQTPLHLACFRGHLEVVAYLLDCGGRELVRRKTLDDGLTPLHCAVVGGHLAICKWLLGWAQNNPPASSLVTKSSFVQKMRCRLSMTTGEGGGEEEEDDGMAVNTTRREESKEDVEEDKAASQAKTRKSRRSITKRLSMVAMLLAPASYVSYVEQDGDGVDEEDREDSDVPMLEAVTFTGKSALALAAQYGQMDIAEYLLEAGATATGQDGMGKTPLHLASESEKGFLVVDLLLEREQSSARLVNVFDKSGQTPLHLASKAGNLETARLLVDYGALLDVSDKVNGNGLTALHLAVTHGHEQLVDMLLCQGASVKKKSRNGSTALHFAAFSVREEIMSRVLSHHDARATVDWKNHQNLSALQVALRQPGSNPIVSMLLDGGAKDIRSSKHATTALKRPLKL